MGQEGFWNIFHCWWSYKFPLDLKLHLILVLYDQSHIALWSQRWDGMCTYVIWEEFWKGIELPVSPLISDCSLCKREPWHLCKGSRGLSLVSRNQFELSLLEIYIFHSACAIQLVFLISDWSLAGAVVYRFWSKQEKLDPRLNLKWYFAKMHKK